MNFQCFTAKNFTDVHVLESVKILWDYFNLCWPSLDDKFVLANFSGLQVFFKFVGTYFEDLLEEYKRSSFTIHWGCVFVDDGYQLKPENLSPFKIWPFNSWDMKKDWSSFYQKFPHMWVSC